MEPTSSADAAVHVVVTGGDPIDPALLRHVPAGARTIGVDSGVGHALALGLRVDVAVGDFDSVAPEHLARAEAAGAAVERHPVAKDATDLELGLHAAMAGGARRVVVLGGHGGRLDHLLANALLLAAAPFEALVVEAHMGAASLAVARPGRATPVPGAAGALVSLLPVGGPATGVVTAGLLYPLRGEELAAGTTRGVSNVVTGDASVTLASGTILVVVPGERVTGETNPHAATLRERPEGARPGEPPPDDPTGVPVVDENRRGDRHTIGADRERRS